MHKQSTTLAIPDTAFDTARVPRGRGTPVSLAKTLLVNALAWLLAWRLSLAMALGRLVLRVWPQFRRA